jgi:triosephosphate isomerase
MRATYLAGNWKMHKTIPEAVALAEELKNTLNGSNHKIMIAPPFTALQSVSAVLKDSNILLGAQNMAGEEQGAHTGEISIIMLEDIGVDVVIIGHSERRLVYEESDELINKKVKLALSHGMDLILCVGETLEQREKGKAGEVVKSQLLSGLNEVKSHDLGHVTIAYEPVWAIGTGKTATPEDADDMHKSIRETLTGLYSQSEADSMVIQYGGSVKPENVKDLMAKENIDGALVGGASLSAAKFVPIVQFDK